MANDKKWYIITSSGEMESATAVQLNDEEYSFLKGIFVQAYENTLYFEYLGGSTELFDRPFDTKEDVIEYLKHHRYDDKETPILQLTDADAPEYL